MSFQKAECLQTPQVHHNMQACNSRMRRYVPTSSLTNYTSRVISGKGHGQRVVYWLACSARVPNKDVLPLWKEFLWPKRRLLSWKLRSCPKASHTALWFIASHLVGVARKETYRRTSEQAFRAPWTFLSESLSLLNRSLDCSSWRKILANPSVSCRCFICTRDFWIGPWTKSPHFFCSSHSPCSLQGEILSCLHRLVPSVGNRFLMNIGSAMPRWWINSTLSRKLSGLEFRVVSWLSFT